MISDLQRKINHLKRETNTAILAHSYQSHDILEIADYTGDSFRLSLLASSAPQKNLLVCGVHFMAETAKILSPEKNVYLANRAAGCPMAEQYSPEDLLALRKRYPDRTVVCYINTTAALKRHCDVCVTSSSAVKIVKRMKAQKILFIPDCNLGAYVAARVPEKDIQLIDGGCPYHAAISAEEVTAAQQQYPNAKLLVHPECKPEVLEKADFIGSTSGIMQYAADSRETEFIIGTESSIAEHLGHEHHEKRFYPISKKLMCPDMKITSLVDVYTTLQSIDQQDDYAFAVQMREEEIKEARWCIDQMLELGR